MLEHFQNDGLEPAISGAYALMDRASLFPPPTAGERSFLTFMIYLNDGFEGGATSFTKIGGQYLSEDDLSVAPRRGMALIFRHKILHTGRAVTHGRKYVLRTDVMYRRDREPAAGA